MDLRDPHEIALLQGSKGDDFVYPVKELRSEVTS